ncbi:MFS transporter [Brevibacterium album]|uniref:MFS transporter n=1 Tax=Brevibacterium album TaxID=417948 RepID=UPI0004136865|nr:MFS transporter [Brevibacterium album]
MSRPAPSQRGLDVLALVCLALLAVCLRPAATSVGPVLAEIEAAFALSGWQTGLLTAMPGFAFAVFGALAFTVLRALGLFWSLAAAAAAIGLGLALRVAVEGWWGFAGFTVLALAGMAMGNVLLPVFAKARFPKRQSLAVTLFTVSLGLGSTLPALLTAPLTASAGGWRLGLGVWAVLPLMALLTWLAARSTVSTAPGNGSPATGPRASSDGAEAPAASAGTSPEERDSDRAAASQDRRRGVVRSRGAWMLMLFFGLQSLHAYTHFGWVAQIYRDAGLSAVDAGLMVTILIAVGVPGGFIAPLIVVRRWHTRWVLGAYGVISMAGYTGLLLAPTALPWLWALCLAIGALSFPSALALISARTRSPEVTAQVSAFVQSAGYMLAAAGPLLIGVVLARTGSWDAPLIGLIVLAAAMGAAGALAGSPRTIDAELGEADRDDPGPDRR